RFGVSLPIFNRIDRSAILLSGLALACGLYFMSRRGLIARIAALSCGYTILVASGTVPDPARSQNPWLATALLIAILWLIIPKVERGER
ncbi:MAG TPA: hypothetical protein PKH77_28105, partial [Anaerolineae bacterium]|nr:hypothetical protein [Anaerolineae bacterium]